MIKRIQRVQTSQTSQILNTLSKYFSHCGKEALDAYLLHNIHLLSSRMLLSFLSNRQFRVVLDGEFSQEYRVNAGFSQGSILGPTLFILYTNDHPDDVICNITIYADDTTHYSKCHQASDVWQKLELASGLESDP